MDRLKFTGQLIEKLEGIDSVLDVGCRCCDLKKYIPTNVQYFGNDLFQNTEGTVDYVGDISGLNIEKKFDVVVALDILEHVDQPSFVFDKLISLADFALVVSLPNCFDLKSRMRFLLRGQLGGKYAFTSDVVLDRHRWIMSRPEVIQFYHDKWKQHHIESGSIDDMKYGDPHGNFISIIRTVFRLLPSNLCTETVFGLFIHNKRCDIHE